MNKKYKILYFRGENKQWYFHIRGRNGRIIAQSEGYKQKQSLLRTASYFGCKVEAM